jgi:flagellar biosynthesis protein FlhB
LKSLAMTRAEALAEAREDEGNPEFKARLLKAQLRKAQPRTRQGSIRQGSIRQGTAK